MALQAILEGLQPYPGYLPTLWGHTSPPYVAYLPTLWGDTSPPYPPLPAAFSWADKMLYHPSTPPFSVLWGCAACPWGSWQAGRARP